VLDNFDFLTHVKTKSTAIPKDLDQSMYSGSAGVLFALFRYSLLLNNESEYLEPRWLDMRLKPAITTNLHIATKRVE
jgi:hypothetical protein